MVQHVGVAVTFVLDRVGGSRDPDAAVTGELVPTRLEGYEADLEMRPVWTPPAAALAANADHAARLDRPAPWVHREMTVLGHLLTAGEQPAPVS